MRTLPAAHSKINPSTLARQLGKLFELFASALEEQAKAPALEPWPGSRRQWRRTAERLAERGIEIDVLEVGRRLYLRREELERLPGLLAGKPDRQGAAKPSSSQAPASSAAPANDARELGEADPVAALLSKAASAAGVELRPRSSTATTASPIAPKSGRAARRTA